MATIRLNKQNKTIKVVNRRETIRLSKEQNEILLKHTGKVGPQGQTGSTGPRGATGVQGPTGAAIQIIGTLADSSLLPLTGNAGDAYLISGDLWVWTGSSWTNVGSIQGPLGYTGSTGPTGQTGSTGPQGNTGAGVTGATGVQGVIGQSGATGSTGPLGNTGSTGPNGNTGSTGPVGITGATGVQGTTGPTGVQGLVGITGATGVQGTTGPTGVQGVVGITGATGVQGTTGPTGPQGLVGSTGATGVQGTQGFTGSTGGQGVTGATGVAGAVGSTGATGVAGAVGSTGATGATGNTGSTGPAGQSFTWEGTWDAGTTYDKDDVVVASDGNDYISKAGGNLNHNPATDTLHTYWDVMIVKGVQGDAGSTGATGPTGITGATGAQGGQGNTGVQGATGVTGGQGFTGANGANGATGATGVQGTQGNTGVAGAVGSTGATGVQGTTGPTGSTGPQGQGGAISIPYVFDGTTSFPATSARIRYNNATFSSVTQINVNTASDGVTDATVMLGQIKAGSIIQISSKAINRWNYFLVTSATYNDPTSATYTFGVTPLTKEGDFSTNESVWLGFSLPGTTGPTGAAGNTGSTGPQGNTGVVGITGATGVQGTTGPTGAAGTAGATGATGSAGAAGSTGATGVQGTTGPTGANGANGATGATGVQGTTGPTGPIGNTGVRGYIGGVQYLFSTSTVDDDPGTGTIRFNNATIGSVTSIYIDDLDIASVDQVAWYDTFNYSDSSQKGQFVLHNNSTNESIVFNVDTVSDTTGYHTISGDYVSGVLPANGARLSAYFAASGDKGNDGAQGTTGPTGANGTNGATGATGVQGTTGPTGAGGAAGATGATGVQGTTGPTGAGGAAGATGATGVQGTTGPTGAASTVPGATGATGVQGTTGPTGVQGATGPAVTTGDVEIRFEIPQDQSTSATWDNMGYHRTAFDKSAYDSISAIYLEVSLQNFYNGANYIESQLVKEDNTVITGTGMAGTFTYQYETQTFRSADIKANIPNSNELYRMQLQSGSLNASFIYAALIVVTEAGGTQGTTGPTGAAGSAGAAGATGATGVGTTGATGPAGTNGATGATGAGASAATFSTAGTVKRTVYNIVDYGAVGDDSTANLTHIQDAIDAAHAAGGGIVWVPHGIFRFSGELTVYSSITIEGEGPEISILKQMTTTGNAIAGVDCASVHLLNFYLLGPNSGSGKGINLTWSTAGNNPYHKFDSLVVKNFGGDGISIQTAIVSNFNKVLVATCGGNAFVFSDGGTSLTFTNCYANANAGIGYSITGAVYTTFNSCAADANGQGYYTNGCQSISYYGCGAEGQSAATLDGTGFKVNNSVNIGYYNCWVYDGPAVSYWATGTSNGIIWSGCAENTPHAGSTNAFRVDSGSTATLINGHAINANLLTGATTVLDATAGLGYFTGNVFGGSLNAIGSSGTMNINANPDGGEYNWSATASGKLAFFGQAGATLDFDMLDGSIYTASVQRLTNAGALVNIPTVGLKGSTSGTTTLQSSAVAGTTTVTVPASNTTLVGYNTVDTLTNKTYDTAGTGNSFSINGVAVTANSGTGAVVRVTSPALVTPDLGTPSALTLTNATGLPIAGLTASTATALGVGSVELGHASDTTISRVSAGQIAVEGVNVLMNGGALGTPSSATLTNATGLPVSGITASTATALGVGSVELGHASDTTLARASAGDVNIEGNIVYRAGGTDVPVADGGTGRSTGTTAYSLIATGTTATGAQQTLANGATTEILVGGGAAALPVWTTATGSGAPVRATSPTLVTPALGTPSSATLTNATGLPIAGLVASTSTAIGVGTIELGAASDTTISRVSAGVIAVEGVNVLLNGGALGTPSSATLTNATGLPVSGITASTSTALGVGSIELGAASDTTLSRSAAGVLAVEGVVIPSISSTNTLTNKRVTKRSGTAAGPGATPTLATDTYDVYTYTALAANITSMTTNLSGTPVTGDEIILGFKDNGTARTITWGASFQSSGVATLLATTAISKQHWVKLMYDGTKWTCMAVDATGY